MPTRALTLFRTPTCDRQTDRHRAIANTASRGKNRSTPACRRLLYLEDAAAGDELAVLMVDYKDLVDIVGRCGVEQQRASGATSLLAELLRALTVVVDRADRDSRLNGPKIVGVQLVQVVGGSEEQCL